MLLRRLKRVAAARWLGILALSLNALVPVHLAFDMAAALEAGHPQHAVGGPDRGRQILALLTGYHEHGKKADDDKSGGASGCAVCSSLPSLAHLATPSLAALPAPSLVQSLATAAPLSEKLCSSSPAPYRSRAPPLA